MMTDRRCWVAVLASAVCLALTAGAASARELTDAQKKLLAQRAARVDGMRKLAEQIKGLQITSSTFVRDFVAEDDRIETEMRAFLRGAKEIPPPRYYADGACDLDMEVTLEWVVTHLKELHTRYYKGDRVKATDFQQMTQVNKRSVIRVTGSGAPPSDEMGALDEPGAPPPPPGAAAIPFGWENVMPQGRLMAVRAASVDGMRKLAERIKGLQITSTTFVKDFVAEDDRIETYLNTHLAGVETSEPRFSPDQICSVECSITLEQIITNLKELHTRYYKGDKFKATDFEQMTQRVDTTLVREEGHGVPPPKYVKQDVAEMSGPARATWAEQTIRAAGNGVPPPDMQGTAQGRLMAARAAEEDAKRKLAEQIDGLMITSDTTVRDFVAEHDEIRSDMKTFLFGAHAVGDPIYDEDGTATVTVEIPLERLWDIISIRMTQVEIRR